MKIKFTCCFSLLFLVSIIASSQLPSDSLKGMQVGLYYFKYDSDSFWTIKLDTTYVTFIDTNNCSDRLHGDIGIFNVDEFRTDYNYCHGTISNQITFFYGGDSLYIKWDHISQPPPNYSLYSNRFLGKKFPELNGQVLKMYKNKQQFSSPPTPSPHPPKSPSPKPTIILYFQFMIFKANS